MFLNGVFYCFYCPKYDLAVTFLNNANSDKIRNNVFPLEMYVLKTNHRRTAQIRFPKMEKVVLKALSLMRFLPPVRPADTLEMPPCV